MHLHVKLKDFLSMFFMATLFFPCIQCSFIFYRYQTSIFNNKRLCGDILRLENVNSMLRFHIIFLFKYSCDFTYDNKIILNQKNEGYQFRHRYNNTANSYIFNNSYRNSTFNSPLCHRICQC